MLLNRVLFMRFVILGLSFTFLLLSAIVTFKAMDQPVRNLADQATTQNDVLAGNVMPESSSAIQHTTENSESNQAQVAELEATIAKLEEKLTTTEAVIENIRTPETKKLPQTLQVFSGTTFRSGRDIINDIPFSIVDKLVKEITAFPDSRIVIEGHTDNIPTGNLHRDNMDLSLRRAKTIANILVSHGIPLERISVMGYGDTRPISTNNTEAGRAKNRRVEVKLMPKEGEN